MFVVADEEYSMHIEAKEGVLAPVYRQSAMFRSQLSGCDYARGEEEKRG
jgi:hypothetical protein